MELPPGSQLAYTEKVTEEIVARLRKRPEVESVFVDGGRVPPGTLEVRRAALIINYTPKNERKITQRELELAISQRTRERAGHPLLVPRRERPARDVAGRDRRRQQHRRQRRQRTGEPDEAHSADRRRDLGNLARPAGAAHPAARGSRRAARRLHRKPVADHPRRHHRRRRPGAGQVRRRRPAGADPRPARRLPPAAICRCSSNCACRSASTAKRAACRCRSSPTSSSIRARPASTATTANARPPWPPIWSAPPRSATPPRRSTTCRS